MNELQIAIRDPADRHNADIDLHHIECGTQVWPYSDQVKDGYTRKLAPMWYGLFRVDELCRDHVVSLEIAGTPYRLFPVVHVFKLKRVVKFPYRPNSGLVVDSADSANFYESLLRYHSWEIELDADEYDVEETLDVQSGRKTRYGRILKHYLVRWKEHSDITWIDEADLTCGALLQEFDRDRVSRHRFEVMHSHEVEIDS